MLKKRGIEIHVRSVFLQGLYFLSLGEVQERLGIRVDQLTALDRLSKGLDIPKHHLLLNFVLLNPHIDKVILGIESKQNLTENLSCTHSLGEVEPIIEELKSLKSNNLKLILPTNW